MAKTKKKFFDDPTRNSIIKAEIVSEYFKVWASIMAVQSYVTQVSYIDLYSGTGLYKDGHKSTPILILESAIRNENIRSKLISVFNDEDETTSELLKEAINNITDIDKLGHTPKVYNTKINPNLSEQIRPTRTNPTFSFIDPFGYKGVTRSLIKKLLNGFGCDVVFFFNYNRINAGVRNSKISSHIESIFGIEDAEFLRDKVIGLDSHKREELIIKTLYKSLKSIGAEYMVPFKFYHPKKDATSHFLIFVTKHVKGYTEMKKIMHKFNNRINHKLNCYEFSLQLELQPSLFGPDTGILEERLLRDFSKRKITAKEIFENHINTLFIQNDFKEALLKLEANGVIKTEPPREKRNTYKSQPTFGESVIVEFP